MSQHAIDVYQMAIRYADSETVPIYGHRPYDPESEANSHWLAKLDKFYKAYYGTGKDI